MSAGSVHYADAEALILRSTREEPAVAAVTLAQAQVHATLALAAATAAAGFGTMPKHMGDAWERVAGETRPRPLRGR